MHIQGSVLTGIAPIDVTFSVVTMVRLVKWLWYFGDGSYSTEKEPKHTYVAPGVYTVTLTATDEYGNIYTVTRINYIYVYAYTVGVEGLQSGYTDVCFKHAVKPSQGEGIAPISGTWVWPMIVSATAKGYTENHENLSLVVNSDDMRIYRIGIPELWVDRAGSYQEAEIACDMKLPEILSRSGEHENVRHIETHVSMRSWDELNYRDKEGYTSDGFRYAQQLSLEMFESGEQIIPASVLGDVNRGGDYAFLKEIEARRIQIKLKTMTSAFRITRVGSHCQELDKRTPPQLNDIPQKRWQKEFNLPDMWFSRNKPTANTNRADLTVWSGTTTPTTGPDGKSSAFNSTGISGVLGYSVSDFTIGAWISGPGVIYSGLVAGGGAVTFEVVGTTLRFSDGIDTAEIELQNSSQWIYVTVIRRGEFIELYENGLMKLSQELLVLREYGGISTAGNGTVFDIRRNARAISGQAVYYYYESVIAGGGGFLP